MKMHHLTRQKIITARQSGLGGRSGIIASGRVGMLMIGAALAFPASAGAAAGNGAALRAYLRAQVRSYSTLPPLHFVANAVGRFAVPRGGLLIRGANGWGRMTPPFKQIAYRSRFAFWGDGSRFRINWLQTETGSGAMSQIEARNGRQFQLFDPEARVLWVWPSRPMDSADVVPVNPILTPLEFVQPPGLRPRGRQWLTLGRLRHNLASVLARCGAVKRLPRVAGHGGLWGSATGSEDGFPAIYEMRVQSKAPHLIVAIRTKFGRAAWYGQRITYRELKFGKRKYWLPITVRPLSGKKGFVVNFRYQPTTKPIPPSVYTLDFKHAKLIIMGSKVIHVVPQK